MLSSVKGLFNWRGNDKTREFFSFSENAPEPALIWVSDNEFFSLIQTDDKIFFSKVSNYLFTGHMFEKKSPNEFALKVGIE